MELIAFKALSFDCYGTLIDWETGLAEHLRPLADRAATTAAPAPSGDALLQQYARLEADQQSATPALPYSQLLGAVYKRVARELGVSATETEARDFGASVGAWPAFADSADALRYLKHHYKLIILSNVDRRSFQASNARLGVEFDAVYTAEDIGSYKPSPRNFGYLLEHVKRDFGLERADLLHTAQSLFHDHAPANACGLASAWIDRRHAADSWGATKAPAGTPKFDFRFESMAALADAHRHEMTRRL